MDFQVKVKEFENLSNELVCLKENFEKEFTEKADKVFKKRQELVKSFRVAEKYLTQEELLIVLSEILPHYNEKHEIQLSKEHGYFNHRVFCTKCSLNVYVSAKNDLSMDSENDKQSIQKLIDRYYISSFQETTKINRPKLNRYWIYSSLYKDMLSDPKFGKKFRIESDGKIWE